MTTGMGTRTTPVEITFAVDDDCDEALTSVVAVAEAEPRGLGALETLAAYLYEDLRALERAYPDALAEALRAPEEVAEDSNLLLKLVCADLEQLVREQHIRAIALVVSGADVAKARATEPERRVVHYRALYQVERPVEADVLDGDGRGALPAVTRREGRRPLVAHLVDGAELTLLLDWTPQAVKRGPALRRPPYQFLWVRAGAARFEDERGTPAGQPGPSGAAGSASGTGGAGGWYVARVADS